MKSFIIEESVVRLERVIKLVNLVSIELIKVKFYRYLKITNWRFERKTFLQSEWFDSFRDHEERSHKIRKASRQTRLFQGFHVYITANHFFFQVALESSLTEERKRGRQYAEEVKEQTKKEMLKYLAEKQEVKMTIIIIYNYPPKGRWIVVDIPRREASRYISTAFHRPWGG